MKNGAFGLRFFCPGFCQRDRAVAIASRLTPTIGMRSPVGVSLLAMAVHLTVHPQIDNPHSGAKISPKNSLIYILCTI